MDNPAITEHLRVGSTNPMSLDADGDKKTVNKFYGDDFARRFRLNKDPDQVGALIADMKDEFAHNARNGLTPNRVVFFHGAEQFYRQLYSTPAGQYWRTGWRDGSSFNPLEVEVNGLTYCESFE